MSQRSAASLRKTDIRPRYALISAAITTTVVIFLICLKAYAYYQSGSASVMATLVDSVSDFSISICSLLAIRYSLKPADDDHRHGHGKIEGLFALFESSFIAGAAVFVIFESLSRFARGETQVFDHMIAIIIMGVSIICSLFLVLVQRLSLKYAPSLAVESNKANYSTDIVVNIGIIGVLVGMYYGLPSWIDPFCAITIAFYMISTARGIAREGLDMLLDRELPGEIRERITRITLTHKGVMGMHDLRTHRSGMKICVSFDIEVDADLSLNAAHDICREVEESILKEFPSADILIHVDPHNDTTDSRHRVDGVHD